MLILREFYEKKIDIDKNSLEWIKTFIEKDGFNFLQSHLRTGDTLLHQAIKQQQFSVAEIIILVARNKDQLVSLFAAKNNEEKSSYRLLLELLKPKSGMMDSHYLDSLEKWVNFSLCYAGYMPDSTEKKQLIFLSDVVPEYRQLCYRNKVIRVREPKDELRFLVGWCEGVLLRHGVSEAIINDSIKSLIQDIELVTDNVVLKDKLTIFSAAIKTLQGQLKEFNPEFALLPWFVAMRIDAVFKRLATHVKQQREEKQEEARQNASDEQKQIEQGKHVIQLMYPCEMIHDSGYSLAFKNKAFAEESRHELQVNLDVSKGYDDRCYIYLVDRDFARAAELYGQAIADFNAKKENINRLLANPLLLPRTKAHLTNKLTELDEKIKNGKLSFADMENFLRGVECLPVSKELKKDLAVIARGLYVAMASIVVGLVMLSWTVFPAALLVIPATTFLCGIGSAAVFGTLFHKREQSGKQDQLKINTALGKATPAPT